MKSNLISKIIKETLFGILQVFLGSVETNFGIATFLLLFGIVFFFIPDEDKPLIFYFVAISIIFLAIRIFYLSIKEIVNKKKE